MEQKLRMDQRTAEKKGASECFISKMTKSNNKTIKVGQRTCRNANTRQRDQNKKKNKKCYRGIHFQTKETSGTLGE